MNDVVVKNNEAQSPAVIREGEGHEQQGALISYSGPLPPASEFAKYETVLPGAADRILGMAEGQSKHRKFIEKVVVICDGVQALLGTLFAGCIALAGIGAGTFLILQDKPITGFATILVPLGTIAGAFVYQKRSKEESSK